MSDILSLVPMTPEERHSLKELPAILRSLKLVLAAVPHRETPRYENGKVILSLNEARKLAGCRAETFLRAIENQEIEGAKKIIRGRIGQWRLPRSAVLRWIESR
jgi:hypothetical protein